MQARIWKAAHVGFPDFGTPLDFGWIQEQGILSPVFYEGCSASELIDSLKCECGNRQMCYTGNTCYQSGIACIELCSCTARDILNMF